MSRLREKVVMLSLLVIGLVPAVTNASYGLQPTQEYRYQMRHTCESHNGYPCDAGYDRR